MAETLVKGQTTDSPGKQQRQIAYRLRADQLAAIDANAQAAGLSRRAYLIQAALGELHTNPADDRFQTIDLRLARIERALGM